MRIPLALLALLICGPLQAADLKILLPLQRTVYQTNERIDLSVARSAAAGLMAGDLTLTLKGEDGSRLQFTFPVPKTEGALTVEHLHLNGWLLRPGKYTVEVAADGATAQTDIDVYSHVRKSSFRLINWGRAKGKAQLGQGEDNLGYNLFYGHYGDDEGGNLIRAGVDFMSNCTMGGGHQMDLRQECDWSDPLVIRGGTRRVVKRAMIDRTRPNVPGVHFYDEPGLTWLNDPRTGKGTPQAIPSQMRSYEAAFGHPLKDYLKIDPKDPRDVALWNHWARWKLGFMDASNKDAQFGVSYVRPDFISANQSQYGWTAFTDGYYYNVVRSLPVISGHGGYHDFGPGYFNPSYFLEMARARDYSRPNWYLPTWYGNTTSDQYRLEQYLSFQTNLQGMISPPDLEPGAPEKSKAAAGIVETNHLMGRLGTIFTTMPVTRPPVALLYSLSQMIEKQTEDRSISYGHATPHGRNLMFTYLAGKLLQQPFLAVVDEDILDGTLAAEHKAVVLTSLDYLDPKVIRGLEEFVAQGGLVLMTGDCRVKIKGAVSIGITPAFPDAAKIAGLEKEGKNKEAGLLIRMRHALAGAKVVADALRPHLDKARIKPVFACTEPGISASRQAAGDIEYLFAVNATHDPEGDAMVGMKGAQATLGFADDGRPFYDLAHGGAFNRLVKKDGQVQARLHFGPGQMHIFARTARPVGGIRTSTPLLRRDYTQQDAPIRLELGAALLDDRGRLLSGSAPLRIRVVDPLGSIRYDLYRATEAGTLRLSLPLAINDAAGKWKIEVSELLTNTRDTAEFDYRAVATASAAAGATRRAVHIPHEQDNIYRFFRTHERVTIVKGSSSFHQAAAERLTKILLPWNVKCSIVNAADVNKPRSISEEDAKTWIGLDYTGRGQIKAGDKNNPVQVGFAVEGPVILLGTPEDNPLIKLLHDQRFLPYKVSKADFPGPGRGLIAWQRDGIGVLQESITLIAYDDKGLAEAVGNLYEMLAGIEPLTPLVLPERSTVAVAKTATVVPELQVAWSVVLPDRIVGLKAEDGKIQALTHAAVLAEVKGGKVTGQRVVEAAAYDKLAGTFKMPADVAAIAVARKQAPADRLVKFALTADGRLAVAYWGGTLTIASNDGKLLAERRLPQDITAMLWADGKLIVGDADGRLAALTTP